MPIFTRVLIFIFALLAPLSAAAWNKGGHQTTGAIAYQELAKSSPAVIARVQEIMKSHPTPSLTVDRAATETTDGAKAERLFMEMAIWSDEVRPPSGYAKEHHHDTWHWINIVYLEEGSKLSKPDEITKDRIFEAFARNVAIVSSSSATDAEKAVALCWIFHLVGDLHQPLHTTALFNEEHPEGDKGGNSTKIRTKEGARVINLHQFWDGALLGSSDPQAARNNAIKLRSGFPKTDLIAIKDRTYLDATSFESWGRQESSPLAVSVAYDGGKLLKAKREDGAFELSPEYIAAAKTTADRQGALAGYRIAEVLTKILAK